MYVQQARWSRWGTQLVEVSRRVKMAMLEKYLRRVGKVSEKSWKIR
jgi:hypothetical protein